jgi:hypothetical protein
MLFQEHYIPVCLVKRLTFRFQTRRHVNRDPSTSLRDPFTIRLSRDHAPGMVRTEQNDNKVMERLTEIQREIIYFLFSLTYFLLYMYNPLYICI